MKQCTVCGDVCGGCAVEIYNVILVISIVVNVVHLDVNIVTKLHVFTVQQTALKIVINAMKAMFAIIAGKNVISAMK